MLKIRSHKGSSVERQLRAAWIVLVGLMLMGCGALWGQSVVAATPEEAVRQSVPITERLTMQSLGQWEASENWVVVLYRNQRLERNGLSEWLGNSLVRREAEGWRATAGGGMGISRQPAPNQVLDLVITSGGIEDVSYAMAYGVVREVEVETVEVTFDTGKVQRSPVQNGVFAAAAENASAVCTVRALNADGEALESIAFPAPPPPPEPGIARPPHNCQPPEEGQ
jgi:hypothetical protein